MKHIEFTKLIEGYEGSMEDMEAREIADHLAMCRSCEAQSVKLAEFMAYSEARAAEDVPQAVTARLLNVYDRRPLQDKNLAPSTVAIGFLIFDDWATALNERYSGMDTRQMLFRVNEYDIDLRIEFVGDNCRLTGQIFPSVNEAVVELRSPDLKKSTLMGEFGEFDLGLAPRGTYDIRITAGSKNLVIESLPLER